MPDANAIQGPIPRGAFTLLVRVAFLVAAVFILAPTRWFDSLLVVLFLALLVAAIVYRIFAKPQQSENAGSAEGAFPGATDDGASASSVRSGPIEPR